MPSTGLYEENKPEKWITTSTGAKIKIEQGQDPEEAMRERFTGIHGLKGQTTRESRGHGHQETHGSGGEKQPSSEPTNEGEKEPVSKHYFQRHANYKSPFKSRDIVVFDKYNQKGIVAGTLGNSIRILNKNNDIISIHKDYVFKADELTKFGHWDALSDYDRAILLKDSNLSLSFIKYDWSYVPQIVKDLIKATSPAGYDMGSGGFNTGVQGRVNPVSTEQTISEQIREEISRRASVAENTPPKILDGNEVNQNLEGQQASTGEIPKEGKFPEKEQNGEKPEYEGQRDASVQGGNKVQEESNVGEGNLSGRKEPPKEKKPKNEEPKKDE